MARPGRPSSYTPELAEAICAEMAMGEPLAAICARKDRPDPRTLYRWLEQHEEFRQMYARGKELQADIYSSQTIVIADKARPGKKTKHTECSVCGGSGKVGEKACTRCNGRGSVRETTIGDMVDRSRLMIDARKWYASKLAPRKYGDRVELAGRVETVSLSEIFNRMSPEELDEYARTGTLPTWAKVLMGGVVDRDGKA